MNRPAKPSDRGPVVWYAIFAVVIVLGIVAVVLSRSSDKEGTGEAGPAQTSDVVVADDSAPALARFESSDGDPAVGRTIPTVSGRTLDGDPITIGPDGKAKVIVFAAHWCPHCQAELPRLVEHLRESPLPDDVEVLGVSTDVNPKAPNYPPKAWLDEIGWQVPTLADSPDSLAAQTYGLSSYPYFVVADADGKVVHRTFGEISMDDFDALVEAARTGKAPQ